MSVWFCDMQTSEGLSFYLSSDMTSFSLCFMATHLCSMLLGKQSTEFMKYLCPLVFSCVRLDSGIDTRLKIEFFLLSNLFVWPALTYFVNISPAINKGSNCCLLSNAQWKFTVYR